MRLAILAIVLAGCSRTALGMDDAGPPHVVRFIDAAHEERDSAPPEPCTARHIRIRFMPAARVSIAVAIDDERERFATIALTEAVALRGIGNRPGASQMNSGYRWPYGRREGVLPFWAQRRVERGGALFPRVIFGDRAEGFASGNSAVEIPSTYDDYFCMTFDREATQRDGLDAVTCSSLMYSNKGRFATEADVAAGYAEPFEDAPGVGSMRPLGLVSLYPPRRDLGGALGDHPDAARFADVAVAAMPEIDAVTLATPRAGERVEIEYVLDASWPDGSYTILVEANTEGDYGGGYDPTSYPTPTTPVGAWDYWAQEYGYPYRGQPSVVFSVPIAIGPGRAATYRVSRPMGRMGPDGDGGLLVPMDGTIMDDPIGNPGSGADRLLDEDGARVTVVTGCI